MKSIRKQIIVHAVVTFAVASTILLIAALTAGHYLTAPVPRKIGDPPANTAFTNFSITVDGIGRVSGWRLNGVETAPSVLLLHGVRSDRRQMTGRAKFLHTLGYTVYLIDLLGHGESAATRMSFGLSESRAVTAAMVFIRRERPIQKLAVIGVSMGAAAASFAVANGAIADALIIESMYPTIDEAIENRLAIRVGQLAPALTPLLSVQSRLWTGHASSDIRPIDAVRQFKAPTLVIAGTNDQHTTEAESRRLFDAIPSRKQLWMVPNLAHVDVHTSVRNEYERRVAEFLAASLE